MMCLLIIFMEKAAGAVIPWPMGYGGSKSITDFDIFREKQRSSLWQQQNIKVEADTRSAPTSQSGMYSYPEHLFK